MIDRCIITSFFLRIYGLSHLALLSFNIITISWLFSFLPINSLYLLWQGRILFLPHLNSLSLPPFLFLFYHVHQAKVQKEYTRSFCTELRVKQSLMIWWSEGLQLHYLHHQLQIAGLQATTTKLTLKLLLVTVCFCI